MPQFAHLPLLLKPDGNGKLSKRDADAMGFPIFPLNWVEPKTGEQAMGFREAGYLPDALINFLAFLGWNPGTEQELFSIDELINVFSIERIGKAGAKFDISKAQWFNQQYLRAKPDDALAEFLLQSLEKVTISCSTEKATKIVKIMRERVTFPHDFWEQGKYFFIAPMSFDEAIVIKKWNADVIKVLTAFNEELKRLSDLTSEQAKSALEKVTKELNIGTGKIMQALRLAITGVGGGPDLMMIMEILGNDEVVSRIDYALNNIQSKVVN
jgi:glutamyl-tRNA synthetase